MKKTTTKTLNMKATTSIKARSKSKDAKARQRLNEDWQRVESTDKYRKAVIKNAGFNTTDKIADKLLNGIFLNLNGRNSDKPSTQQKRLLRRIVEKRQAQAIHSKLGKRCDRKVTAAVITNSTKCMERLHNLRFAC